MLFKQVIFNFLFCTILSSILSFGCQASEDKECSNTLSKKISFFKNQEEINEKVITSAIKIYKQIHENWSYPDEKMEFSTKSSYWKISLLELKNGSVVPMPVLKKTNISLFDALQDLAAKSSVLDCMVATKLVKTLTLANLLGKDVFDFYVKKLLVEKNITLESEWLFHHLPFGCSIYRMSTEKKSGHFVYITNIYEYPKLIYNGSSQGENVVCGGKDKFIGFGAKFKNGLISEEEIENSFYEELSEVELFNKNCDKDKFKIVRRENQKHMDSTNQYGYFDVDKINKLIKKYKKKK